jgi:hypothetical protein
MTVFGTKASEEKKSGPEDTKELRLNHACFITTTYLQRLSETYPLKAVLQKQVVTIAWDGEKKRAVVTFGPRKQKKA